MLKQGNGQNGLILTTRPRSRYDHIQCVIRMINEHQSIIGRMEWVICTWTALHSSDSHLRLLLLLRLLRIRETCPSQNVATECVNYQVVMINYYFISQFGVHLQKERGDWEERVLGWGRPDTLFPYIQ